MTRDTGFANAALLALGLLCMGVSAAAAVETGPARLLRDINRTLSYDMGSFPEEYHRLGNLTLFRASTAATGMELCRTDGTEAGTFVVKDIWPGSQDGARFSSWEGTEPFDPADLGNQVLFVANDGVHGWELWKSDGTGAGTAMVKEIRPGAQGPFDAIGNTGHQVLNWSHVEAGGLVYFTAADGVHGVELWRTDGTEAGTFMLEDIAPGSQSAFGSGLNGATVGGVFYFAADDGFRGIELWGTEGTPGSTYLVRDIAVGSSNPSKLLDLQGTLVFWATSGSSTLPYRSDGTFSGTVPVRPGFPWLGVGAPQSVAVLNDLVVFPQNQYLYAANAAGDRASLLHTFHGGFTVMYGEFNGRLFLAANDPDHGFELWQTDGTQAGTSLVKDINPGSAWSYPWNLVSAGGKIFFVADDGVHGQALWTSDGTEAGTAFVAEFTPGPAEHISTLFESHGLCFVTAYEDPAGYRLWVSDGTASGTRRLDNLTLGSHRVGPAPDGSVLVSADDGIHGIELWRSDGSQAGTVLLKDINPLVRTNPSSVVFLGTVSSTGNGQRMLFSADDGVHGRELWASDGTAQGTSRVTDIQLGPLDTFGYSAIGQVHGGALYFTVSDEAHGQELWRSDGTAAGTTLVADIIPGPVGAVWSAPVAFQGSIYFAADDGVHGLELWKSDGTAAGTVLAAETEPGPGSFYPTELFATGDMLFFSAATPSLGNDSLWRSDGSQAGTFLLRDPDAGGGPYYPNDFTRFGERLFFSAFDWDHGWEPWVSDGTEAGTRVVRDIHPGPGNSVRFPSLATELAGALYFKANDGIHAEELWKTDGTEAGTVLVKDVRPGGPFLSSGFTALAPLNGFLYFDAISTPTYIENELWRTDGTEEGTVQVAELLGRNLYAIQAVNSGLLWTSDKVNGYELWGSDGTAQGTRLAQDIAPGPPDSRPHGFTDMGSRVFFIANDGAAGDELWVARTAILLNQPARAITDLQEEVKALKLAKGLKAGLAALLGVAERALARDRAPHAITALDVFGKYLDVLAPRWMPESTAADLREFAEETIGLLESAP